MPKCDFKKFQCNVIKITLEQVFKVTLLICSKKKNSHTAFYAVSRKS